MAGTEFQPPNETQSKGLPAHLKRYVVEQNYERYTAIDQAVWRFIMRQLTHFLAKNGHPCYLEGLEKTGISVDSIPKISEMSARLSQYGWRATPVSGFIPPAAFMEMQSLGFLPIACDMRTIEHLAYTPAPDIVHEAAGHAPILIDREFSSYLHKYAEVAKKAILHDTDLENYEAIRELSDLKEDPSATEVQIREAYARVDRAKTAAGNPSEAALLARMNWWTAEYGMVGTVESPKIYGAGLMSSVGESRTSLRSETRKIPFSIECLDFNYDITEPQPQIFVTNSFAELVRAIDEVAATMAFRRGGRDSLDKILKAKTVNTVVLDSGLQVSGKLIEVIGNIDYLRFDGACQLSYQDRELQAQGKARHAHGFGMPLGLLKGYLKEISSFTDDDLKRLGIVAGTKSKLVFQSGLELEGVLISSVRRDGRLLVLTFTECTVKLDGRTLFQPEWGEYDLALGVTVPSVFGGPADREAYGETQDFVAKRVPVKIQSEKRKRLVQLYQIVRSIRESAQFSEIFETELSRVIDKLNAEFGDEWLLRLEVLELGVLFTKPPAWSIELRKFLEEFAAQSEVYREAIMDGLSFLGIRRP